MENKFMRVEEVAEVLEVSTSFAYKVIRQLNDELKANGTKRPCGRQSKGQAGGACGSTSKVITCTGR